VPALEPTALFDNLVGSQQQCPRNRDPHRLSGFAVYHQLEYGGLLDRKIARPGAGENLVDVGRRTRVFVVVPFEEADAVTAACIKREETEAKMRKKLLTSKSTWDMLNLEAHLATKGIIVKL